MVMQEEKANNLSHFEHAADILAITPVPIVLLSPDNIIEYVNAAAEIFFHTSKAMLVGCHMTQRIPADNALHEQIEQVRSTGVSSTIFSLEISTPHLGEKMVDVSFSKGMGLCARGIVLTFREHSPVGQTEKIATTMRSVQALSVMLAHEIRNPLSGIRGAGQLLEEMVPPHDRRLARLIVDETDRIDRLIGQMEIFSDHRVCQHDPVNIHRVLDRVIDIAQHGFAKTIQIQKLYDPSLPPAMGNFDQLVQIFLNLVKNAAEAVFERAEKQIAVQTQYCRDDRNSRKVTTVGNNFEKLLWMTITITDNGPGIADDLVNCLFHPFITTKTNGSGLGLALVAKLVQDHKGYVDVSSRPGHTSFCITLPMVKNGLMAKDSPRKK